jgi:acyl carrier protein
MPRWYAALCNEEYTMSDDDIVRMTNEVFEESFEIPAEELQAGRHVFDDLGLDSLDTVDLVVALQKKFDVRIRSDERVREIRTLGDIYEFIRAIREEQGGTEGQGA